MSESPDSPPVHDFGIVTEHSDCFEFHIDGAAGENCRLVALVQTERGPRRTTLVEIAGATWRKINTRVVRELAQDMGETELVGKKAPGLRTGINRLSTLVGRELALLLWALQEDGAVDQLEAILHGWRELAREERWWLFAKASAHGQQTGSGWRRALFHALSETVEFRAETRQAEKKSPKKSSSRRSSTHQHLVAQSAMEPPPEMPLPRRRAAKRRTTVAAVTTLK